MDCYDSAVATKVAAGAPDTFERLGRALFEKMEHLDPSEDRDWVGLSEREREFFCLSAKAVVDCLSAERSASLGELVPRQRGTAARPDSRIAG